MDNFTVKINMDNLLKGVEISEQSLIAVNRAIENATDEVKDKLIEKLSDNLGKYGLSGSKLKDHLVAEEVDDGILIYADTEYAEFVEFGTGIVGSENPHPKPINWEYDVNDHGDEGWKYIGDDGKLHWTKGMPSRPFIYDTWLWGSRSITQIFRKHVRRELKKVIH